MILPPKDFLTHSMREKSWGIKAARILSAALAAVEPGKAVKKFLIKNGNQLTIGEEVLNPKDFNRIFLIGVGKAAFPMCSAAADILAEDLTRGFILTKPGSYQLPDSYAETFELLYGGHPLPNPDSIKSTKRITDQLINLTTNDLVILLLSGGGSALFCAPSPGISLDDLIKTTQCLLASGADIKEINTLRKHISEVKGGQLARKTGPAKTVTLILSDVMGDPLDMIASGPTVPDPSTFQNALDVIQKYDLQNTLPLPVIERISSGCKGAHPETPKPGDPVFTNTSQHIIGNNLDAVQAGLHQAEREGFNAGILPDVLDGEAHLVGAKLGEFLCRMAREEKPLPRPACLIGGGETTVTLPTDGEVGRGGRNLETALGAVQLLNGLPNGAIITLATDGEDGVTDAAGAVVTGDSFSRSQNLQVDSEYCLQDHNSYFFFKALDDLLLIGQTQTNVNDLCFLFTF
ncbi:MAG: glycerate kinase [Anaerolineales bacterium]